MTSLIHHINMKSLIGSSLFIFLCVLAFFVGFNEKSLFEVNQILITPEMNSMDKLAWEETNKNIESSLSAYKGKKIWEVSLSMIREQLVRFPSIQKLQVQKVWPNKLEVSYALPELKAIYPLLNGKYQILATDGRWIGPFTWSRLPGLPWMRGDWVVKKPEMISVALQLLEQLPKKSALSAEQVSEIQFSELDGFLLTLVKSGQQIRFGTDDFEIKSLRGLQVLDYLQTRGLESRVIDLNFSKKVLVRLRNHP